MRRRQNASAAEWNRRSDRNDKSTSHSAGQYCGGEDIGLGWQHGEALVTFKKHGMLGNRLRYLICRRCGAVLYQYVAEPYKYPPVK